MNVVRRVGGLEVVQGGDIGIHLVVRRVGGLEVEVTGGQGC